MKLSVIIPAYNEIKTIKEILDRVRKVKFDREIIIVDDFSTDGTREFVRSLKDNNLKAIFHSRNMGKGACVRTAFEHIEGDIIIIQDADLEYDPREYPRLLEPILDGRADVVYGSRFLGGPHRVLFFWHYLGNQFLTFLSNLFTNLNLTDMETGLKIFKKEVIKGIKISSNRFGFEPEITAKLAKKRCKIYEVPISYSGRDYSEGKKITYKDGIAAIFAIIRYNLFD
ncbi:MAG: glycosyltransferase family 2 protein [Candidatus Omnitrophota bacterium]